MAVAATTQRAATLRGNESAAQRFDIPRRLTLLAAAVVVLIVFLLLGFVAWNGIQIFIDGYPLDNVFSTTWSPTTNQVRHPALRCRHGRRDGRRGDHLHAAVHWPGDLHGRDRADLGEDDRAARHGGLRRHPQRRLGLARASRSSCPSCATNFAGSGFTLGFSWFAGSLVLALMILPTITSISYDVIRRVPQDLRTASLALGTTRWQTIRHVVLPAATAGHPHGGRAGHDARRR